MRIDTLIRGLQRIQNQMGNMNVYLGLEGTKAYSLDSIVVMFDNKEKDKFLMLLDQKGAIAAQRDKGPPVMGMESIRDLDG